MRVEEYREQGYVACPQLVRPEEVEAVRAEAKALFVAQMRRHGLVGAAEPSEEEFEDGMEALFQADLQAFVNTGKQAQHLISLHRLSLDERIVEVLRELGLEQPTISTRPVMFFNARRLAKKDVYWKLDSHQDWRSMQGSLDAVVVWLPLADVDRALGALEVLPRSHLAGLLDSTMTDGYGKLAEEADDADWVSLELVRGDAVFFSAFLVHRSGINETRSIRWSCHFRYNNLAERTFVERGFPHPYVYGPQEELITPGFPSREALAETFR